MVNIFTFATVGEIALFAKYYNQLFLINLVVILDATTSNIMRNPEIFRKCG